MKIIWSDFASQMLVDIFEYHKTVVSLRVARKIKDSIFFRTRQLEDYPKSGQIELLLEGLQEEHRYLVVGNYKIIYKIGCPKFDFF